MTSLQPFFQRSSIPFGHEMSSVQGMNQFGGMNEDVVEEVNLGIDNCVMKREDDFRKGNDGLVFKSDELEAGGFTAGTSPGWQGEGRIRNWLWAVWEEGSLARLILSCWILAMGRPG